MLFNSATFLIFFAVVFGLYLPAPRRVRNALLLVASYVFYGAWDWRFLGLIAVSTAIDYWSARAIEGGAPERRERWLALSVCANLGILAFFKYFNFFIDSFVELARVIGWSAPRGGLEIVLPVGISFYTFQTMSYTIDVYRGRMPAVRDFGLFALYVVYFPQLVAGPIERATNLLPQLDSDRRITWDQLRDGGWLVLVGLFKKVVVADNMARVVDPVFSAGGPVDGVTALLAVYAFALQIYADFSGYTDIARGVSKMLGVELMLNFRRPYFAADPREFWQRWHISLSQWLRDYLYIPLGGNRGGAARNYRNLMLTMLLGGLWHGASWMFVIWGAIHGGLLVAHRLWLEWIGPAAARLRWLVAPLAWLGFFHAVCFAWIFFRARSMAEAGNILSSFGGGFAVSEANVTTIAFMLLCAGPLLALDAWEEVHERLRGRTGPPFIFGAPAPLRGFIYAVLIVYLAVVGAPAGVEFIYFQF